MTIFEYSLKFAFFWLDVWAISVATATRQSVDRTRQMRKESKIYTKKHAKLSENFFFSKAFAWLKKCILLHFDINLRMKLTACLPFVECYDLLTETWWERIDFEVVFPSISATNLSYYVTAGLICWVWSCWILNWRRELLDVCTELRARTKSASVDVLMVF